MRLFFKTTYMLFLILSIATALVAEEPEIDEKKNEPDIYIGINSGSKDILDNGDIYTSPYLGFSYKNLELQLTWQSIVYEETKNDFIELSLFYGPEITDYYSVEFGNDTAYSFIDDEIEGVFYIGNSLKFDWLFTGFEFQFDYQPENKSYVNPFIEFIFESDDYGTFALEVKYYHEMTPDEQSSETEGILKYELEVVENLELKLECSYVYDHIEKSKTVEPLIGIKYTF